MSRLRISFLGPPQVELEEKSVRLETRKSLAILAFLSVSKRQVPREVLAAMFWGEYDQQHAQANLRRNLSSLNARLSFEWLIIEREAISLVNPTNLWLDVEEFIHRLNNFRQHGCEPQGICPECVGHLEATVTLYRGDFLEGLNLRDCPEFDDWQSNQREMLRKQLAFALEKLAFHYETRQNWEKAIEYTKRWVALDNLDEAAQQALLQRYAQSGNRNAALRQYDEFTKLLKEELDQEPEQKLRELHEQIRVGEFGENQARYQSQNLSEKIFSEKEPILKIKIFVPSPSHERVVRARLLTIIQKGLQCPLTLISAPAGFGKTTLLSEWASEAPVPIAWFSIDKGDNDPARFMTYLVSALESIQPGIGSEARLMLRSFRPIAMQSILAGLSNRLFSTETPFALVLDDYHLIESQEIHQTVTYILEHLPPHVHVTISTRSDPPLPLFRFRARNQMVEIRTQDLRFTSEESIDFLNRVMGLTLAEEDVAILDSRTEGWAVGLQLAALSLRGRADTASFIRAFSGSHHYVLDYLVEEVLNRLPGTIINFLLQTSILERLNQSLCNAVTNQPDSQKILETIEKENLFLVSLDDERCWYRYHHLFAELLQARLQEMMPDGIPELHHRAALWHEEHGSSAEAIPHALAAMDYAHAARLVEYSANTLWFHNEGFTLFQWMNAIPDREIQSRPRFNLFKALVFLHDAHFEEARICLDSAVEWFNENWNPDEPDRYLAETRGIVAALRSSVYSNLGDSSLAVSEANCALELLPENNSIWRGIALMCLGFAHEVAGNEEQVNQAITQADITIRNAQNTAYSMLTIYNLGAIQLMRGLLHEASKYYKEVIYLADQYKAERLHELGESKVDLAWVLCEWDDLPAAEEQLKQGLEIGRQIDSFLIQITGHLVYARILQAQGNREGAFDEVNQARQMAETNQISIYAEPAESYETRLDLLCGNQKRASLWKRKQDKLTSILDEGKIRFPPHQYDYNMITFVRVLFSEGETAEALRWLDKLLLIAESVNKIDREIEILILRAMILHRLGDLNSAWSDLEQALLLGEPQSYCRIFLDERSPLENLLNWGIEHEKLQEIRYRVYAEKLLHSFQAERKDKALEKEVQHPISIVTGQNLMVEPLTLRERDVLKLMADGLSNQQIATKMVLSVGTIKIHIHHILGKLDVPTRSIAVIRAKELNL